MTPQRILLVDDEPGIRESVKAYLEEAEQTDKQPFTVEVAWGTGVRNVEKFVSELFRKTDTTHRVELARYALENGLSIL